jgi:DNA polymerase-3 subunit alpha
MQSIPLFKSHYSIGKSILTLEDNEEPAANKPSSAIDIAKKHNLKSLFLIEDSMSGFLEAFQNCENNKIKLIFGLRVNVCEDASIKDKDSVSKECKYVILAKNIAGYKRLIKISSDAACEGFYYQPRTDLKKIKESWSNDDLQLCVPFYDSFLSNNTLTFSLCFPDFSFAKPVFFVEDNDIPFDYLIKNKILQYCKDNKFDTLDAKSIYYEKKEDFKSYLTFKCINNRTTLENPRFDHLCSNEFSFESWEEQQA